MLENKHILSVQEKSSQGTLVSWDIRSYGLCGYSLGFPGKESQTGERCFIVCVHVIFQPMAYIIVR